MTRLTSKVPLLSPRMVPAALCWLFWNYGRNKVRGTGNKNVLRVSICFIWTHTFHRYDRVFRTFTGRVLRRGRGNMLERLCLKLLNISQLPAVVALVPRTTPPLQLGQELVGDLIRGSEVGLISTNMTHDMT